VLYSIFTLIVDTVAGVLAGVLLLRFWMQAIRVRPPAAVAQFIFQLSDWLVRPMRRLVPGIRGYDWSSLVGAFLVAVLVMVIHVWMMPFFSVPAVFLFAFQRLLQWIIYGFIGSLILEAIFSWVNPRAPLAPFVRALNDPLLRPLRRLIPLVGNIDLTPLVVLVLLQIALQLVGMLGVLLG
jgi:YggT family protein